MMEAHEHIDLCKRFAWLLFDQGEYTAAYIIMVDGLKLELSTKYHPEVKLGEMDRVSLCEDPEHLREWIELIKPAGNIGWCPLALAWHQKREDSMAIGE